MCRATPRGQIRSHCLDFQMHLIRALLKLYFSCSVLCASRSFQVLYTCDIFLSDFFLQFWKHAVPPMNVSAKILGSCENNGDELSSHLSDSSSVLLRTMKWRFHKKRGKCLGGKVFFSMVDVAFRVVCDMGVRKKKEGLVISGRR